MTCTECQKLIEAYLDGELDLVRNLEIEQHLNQCATCMTLYQKQLSLKKALNNGSLYFATPPALSRKLQKSLHRLNRKSPLRVMVGVAAALAVSLVLSFIIFSLFQNSSNDDALAKEIVASHVRSLMVNHLTDVTSTDQHTVKPWFNNKLDFSPTVEDLSNKGFPLIGGRLDYLNNRMVAALIYQKGAHTINMFIWPTQAGNDLNLKYISRQGFFLYHWSKSGMNYWAISDLNTAELQEFVQLIQALT